MSCPTRPYFFSISQTVHSFIGKWDKNETVNREIKRVFEGLKSDLRGVRLDRVDLSGVDFRNAVLDSSLLTDVDLSNARLHQASFRNAELHFCSLVGAQLSSTDFTQSLIHRSDLSNIRFEEIWDLRETSFPNPLPDFRVLKLYRWSSLPETEDFMRCFARTVFNRSRVSLPDSALVERFPEGSFSFK